MGFFLFQCIGRGCFNGASCRNKEELIAAKKEVSEAQKELTAASEAESQQESIAASEAESQRESIKISEAESQQESIKASEAESQQESVEASEAESQQESVEASEAESQQESLEESEALAAESTGNEVGDIITFGTYEQDNDSSNGSEPIEWLVLDKQEDKALVISKYALDVRRYDLEEASSTEWETCELCRWLYREFINEAFSAEEQEQIELRGVIAEDNEEYKTDAGNNTKDRIFLLSISEAQKYFADDTSRICYPTNYAVAQGGYISKSGAPCLWWLRTPGVNSSYVTEVGTSGSVDYYGFRMDESDICVRPAMWINLNQEDTLS